MIISLLFKSALQNIRKHKFSSILNSIGFTIAITSAILIWQYVRYEFSYDNFQVKKENIYRLELFKQTMYPAQAGEIINNKIPEIKRHCTFSFWGDSHTISTTKDGELHKIKGNETFTESTFAEIFTIKTLSGDIKNTLLSTDKVLIPESYARKLFGSIDVVGKAISIDNGNEMTIGAVIEDIPDNGSIPNGVYLSLKCRGSIYDWSEWSFNTFFEIPADQNITKIEKKIFDLLKETNTNNLSIDVIKLRSLKDIHFTKGINYEYAPVVNKTTIDLLFIIGLLVLAIGIINFIIFTTALQPKRAKYINIHKIFGTSKWKLQSGIILESVLLAILSAILSFLIITILITKGIISRLSINFDLELNLSFFFLLIATGIVVGLLAGIFPAFAITSQEIIATTKSKYVSTPKSKTIRGLLIGFQFFISITLIICVLFIFKQRSFLFNYDTGIARNNIIYFKLPSRQSEGFINDVLKNRFITDHTFADHGPQNEMMQWGRTIDGRYINYYVWPIGKNFLNFFNIKTIEGRNFSDSLITDRNNFIFNKAAVEQFGWEKPIGKELPGFDWRGRIVGITNNFNYASLHRGVVPLCFWRTDERTGTMFVKYTGNTKDVLSYIKDCYAVHGRGLEFEYMFIDDTFKKYYEKENKLASLITVFGIIAILISSLGIIGLSIFISQYKIREISIRKVNGAKIFEILAMLNIDFIQWIVIAFILSFPVAWYAMHKWLENFAYKTELSWWIFTLGGLITLVIALLTVSWQSWRAATRNPVVALRYE